MPTATELSIQLDDEPGTLGQICRTLADRGVNILAFHSQPLGRRSQVRLVVDDPKAAASVLDKEKLEYTEVPIAHVNLPHRPGELARAASKLGEANININYAYCGVDATTNEPLFIFGVSDAGRAAKILDEAATAASA
jgi:hypothetical protein